MASLLEKISATLKGRPEVVEEVEAATTDPTPDEIKAAEREKIEQEMLKDEIVIEIRYPSGIIKPEINIKNWEKLNARRIQMLERFVNRKVHELRSKKLHELRESEAAGETA